MGCGGKVTGCSKTSSSCVVYEGGLPSWTNLSVGCATLDDVVSNMYSEIGKLQNATNIELLNTCLDYGGDFSLSNVVGVLDGEVCGLKSFQNSVESGILDISNWNIDLKCLEGECAHNIQTIKDLIQALVNKVCPNE